MALAHRSKILVSPVATEKVSSNSFRECQASRHESDHGDVDHGFARLRLPLVVFAVPAIASKPGKGAFHNPALCKHNECFGSHGFQDGLEDPTERLFDPLRQTIATVGAVGKQDS